jgi:predicted transcriptional regulator
MDIIISMKDIHIFIHDELDKRLGRVADASSSKKSALVREAVSEYVARKEQELVQQQMREYAAKMAPGSAEFAAETEAHVSKVLERDTKW